MKKKIFLLLKIIFIIAINLTILYYALKAIDYLIYLKSFKNASERTENFNPAKVPYSHKMSSFDNLYENAIQELKPVENKTSKKRPIVIFGCSYAYGSGLKDNQSFSYQLSKYTGRPIYNRAYPGWGIQHMLYQLSLEDFYEEVPEPEYIIFVYNPDLHIHRLYEYEFFMSDYILYLRYKNKNGKLERIKDLPEKIRGLYITRQLFKFYINEKRKDKYIKQNSEFIFQHFIQAKEEVLKHYKNIKFIVLFYDEKNTGYLPGKNDYLKKLLADEDFTVIDTSDLVGRIYKCPEDCLSETDIHPNEKIWKELTPKLAKKLNL